MLSWLRRLESLGIGDVVCLVVLAALGAACMWPVGFGLPLTHDGLLHLFRFEQFYQSLAAGIWYPRWAPDVAFGYGAPIFNYYPPLTYYLASLFALPFGFEYAWVWVALTALVGSGWSMYLLGRVLGGRWAALLGAAVYVLAPYHLIDIHVRGALPEALAFVWLPLVIAGIELVARRGWVWWWLVTLGVAGLAFTHLVTLVLAAPLFVVWTLIAARRESVGDWSRQVGVVAGAAVLGVLLTAVSWLPAFLERGYVRFDRTEVDPALGGVGFWPLDRLLSLNPLLQAKPNYTTFLDGMLNLGQLVVLIGGAVALVVGWRRLAEPVRRAGVLAVATAVIGVALVDPISKPFWNLVGGTSMVWFPYRLLTLVALSAGLLVIVLVHHVVISSSVTSRSKAVLGLGLLVVSAVTLPGLWHGSVQLPLRWDAFLREPPGRFGYPVGRGPGDLVTAYEMSTGSVALTATGEFIPATANEHLARSPKVGASFGREGFDWIVADFGPQEGEVRNMVRSSPEHLQATIRTEVEGPVSFAVFWMPQWRALINGEARPSQPNPATGFIQVVLPPGTSTVRLEFVPSSAATVGAWASGVAGVVCLAVLAGLLVAWIRRSGVRRAALGGLRGGVAAFTVVAAATCTAALAALLLIASTRTAIAAGVLEPGGSWDSDFRFADGRQIRLEGFSSLFPSVVRVDLHAGDAPREYRLRVRGDDRTWVEKVVSIGTGLQYQANVRLEFPDGAPNLPYVVEVVVDATDIESPGTLIRRAMFLGSTRTWPYLGSDPDRLSAGTNLTRDWALIEPVEVRPWEVRAGGQAWFTALLRAIGFNALEPGYTIRLYDELGVLQQNQTVTYQQAGARGRGWLQGDPVRTMMAIDVRPDLPPGIYQAEVILLGPDGELDRRLTSPGRYPVTVLPARTPSGALSNGVRLDRLLLDQGPIRGGTVLGAELTWSGRDVDPATRVVVEVVDSAGRPAGRVERPLGSLAAAPEAWRGGTIRYRVEVPIPREAASGPASVRVALVRPGAALEEVATGSVEISGAPVVTVRPPLETALDVRFGDRVALTGWQLRPIAQPRRAGERVDVTLGWQALGPTPRDYAFSFQLLGDDGRPVAQFDGPPGQLPTSAWTAGEYQLSSFGVLLPVAGRYRTQVVVYDPGSGERLPGIADLGVIEVAP